MPALGFQLLMLGSIYANILSLRNKV